jgi:hypothetical protein
MEKDKHRDIGVLCLSFGRMTNREDAKSAKREGREDDY